MWHGLNRLPFLIFGLALVIAYALGVQAQKNAVIIAEASVTKKAHNIALNVVLAGACGAALGAGVLFARRRRRRPVVATVLKSS